MIEGLLGISIGATLTDLGALSALTTIVTQVLKAVLPESFPTQLLATITALIISIVACILFYGVAFKTIIIGVLVGFVVAFVAMFGFDSLKDIWSRFNGSDIKCEEFDNLIEAEEEEDGNG